MTYAEILIRKGKRQAAAYVQVSKTKEFIAISSLTNRSSRFNFRPSAIQPSQSRPKPLSTSTLYWITSCNPTSRSTTRIQ